MDQHLKLIHSRMVLDLAYAISNAPDNLLHVDDALVCAAAPLVRLDHKRVAKGDLKRLMVETGYFFNAHPRFRTLTKVGVSEGLRCEWLPSLESDDKATLLSDITLLAPGVSEDGHVLFDPQLLASLVAAYTADTETYGSAAYASTRKTRRKTIYSDLTSISRDTDLSDKLAPYVNWYKRKWYLIHPEEEYKWEAVKHFQSHFDIDAPDLAENLRVSFGKAGNLLAGPMYMPMRMLVGHAAISPEAVRSLLRDLYDEEKPLEVRVEDFLEGFKTLHEVSVRKGHFRPKDTNQQSVRSISVYLSLRYPDRYFLYKSGIWDGFIKTTALSYPSSGNFVDVFLAYEAILPHIKEFLKSDGELMEMLRIAEPDDPSDGNLLTQDFLYAVSDHLPKMGFD